MKFQDLTQLLEQDESIFKPRKIEDRKVRYEQIIKQQIQDYIKNGSKGNLILGRAPIKSLPDNLKYVGGNLGLYNTQITSLPAGLKVGGYLYLINTPITSLPAGLKVGGNLDLTNTPITSLPAGLKVGGGLSLDNTQITSLPADLKVGGGLLLYNTPIAKQYTREQLKKMYPGVKGYIYI